MKITHDSVMRASRYRWGEAYVISFISEIYKYKNFRFKSNKNYYIDEANPSIEIDTRLNKKNKRYIRDFNIVLVNIANLKLRRITKSMLKYIE